MIRSYQEELMASKRTTIVWRSRRCLLLNTQNFEDRRCHALVAVSLPAGWNLWSRPCNPLHSLPLLCAPHSTIKYYPVDISHEKVRSRFLRGTQLLHHWFVVRKVTTLSASKKNSHPSSRLRRKLTSPPGNQSSKRSEPLITVRMKSCCCVYSRSLFLENGHHAHCRLQAAFPCPHSPIPHPLSCDRIYLLNFYVCCCLKNCAIDFVKYPSPCKYIK